MFESVSSRNKLILRYPASWWRNMWRDALPSGNGKIGAAVYGAIKQETILINHGELWHWGKKDPVPDVSHTLSKVRELMDRKEYLEASWVLTNALKEQGYASTLAKPCPLVDLKLTMPCEKGFRHYRRGLNMETGEVVVQWKEGKALFERSLFVSRTDEIVVYEIKCHGGLVNGIFSLALHDGDDGLHREIQDTVDVRTEYGYIYYAAKNDDGTDFGAVLRLIPMKGSVTVGEGSLSVFNAEKVLVLVKVFIKGERDTEWRRLKGELSAINKGYDELLKSHVQVHGRLFNSASIELGEREPERSNEELLLEAYEGETPTSLIEKMWAYGRYLFISATREDGQPVNMYGLWGGGYKLMWSHYMANENIQMMYWHVPVGGLTELMPAFFRHYESLMDDFRENARKLYGCRGIYVPAGSSPGMGVPNQIVPVIMNWTSAAGWLAHHYYNYYLYTGDKQYLKEKALPFMREVALFYEDFLVMGDDGYYKYYPSVSPENTPQNYMPKDGQALAHPMPTTINATMDFAIMKELLRNLIEGSKAVGMYNEELSKWEEMLSHIPPYMINRDGAIKEWMHPDFDDRYDHRHLSHIYPLFPGQEIQKEENPELFKAFEIAVKKRILGAQTGWSLTHMACIYARLGCGDAALECLELLSRSCLLNNFYTLHNDWRNMGITLGMQSAPIQMDANMGWTAAVQEMLLYSSPRMVKILPACPAKWKKGKVRDLRFCTGKISFWWDRDVGCFEADIMAERDTKITVRLPDVCSRYEMKGEGVQVRSSELGEDCIDIVMKTGNVLHITMR